MGLNSFQIGELGVFVVSVIGAFAVLVKTIQKSRCKDCDVCWGMVKCNRVVPPDDEVAVEVDDSPVNNSIQ